MNPPFPYTIYPLGDSALTLDFGNIIEEKINHYVLYLFHYFKSENHEGITDIVPAFSSLTFHYNVRVLRQPRYPGTAFKIVTQIIESALKEDRVPNTTQHREISIPVCYSPTFGVDIEFIGREKQITTEQIINLHTQAVYTVYMIGFLPGFPYMGTVHDAIAVPRKKQPRAVVPAGAVGIAGKQTGIYSMDSPGGWQIIGRTPLHLFDKEQIHPVFLQPGDKITFYSITEDEFQNY